ncbi:pilus assembly protein PilP [Neptunicella sp. SCSIO 80796]|uniref:pilus assembly protein PilP n=1 Tax=Neptunicella plasticusilytica TaxID=3117012 RepID=UPI003A4E031E
MRKWLLVCSASLLAACQPDVSDLQLKVDEIKANTTVTVEPYPEFKRMPVFEYKAENRRSPFQRLTSEITEIPESLQKNCLQPDFKRKKQPLERFGIDALEIRGSFTAKGVKWALIQTNNGGLHKVKVGDHLGLFFGRVTSITNGAVFITEMLPDGTGCWQTKEAKLTRSSTAGEQTNV